MTIQQLANAILCLMQDFYLYISVLLLFQILNLYRSLHHLYLKKKQYDIIIVISSDSTTTINSSS